MTECAIAALVSRPQPLVAVLWGRDAATLKPMLTGEGIKTIESVHPSPLSASRGFFGSRPFSRANELLAQLGAEPIDAEMRRMMDLDLYLRLLRDGASFGYAPVPVGAFRQHDTRLTATEKRRFLLRTTLDDI